MPVYSAVNLATLQEEEEEVVVVEEEEVEEDEEEFFQVLRHPAIAD